LPMRLEGTNGDREGQPKSGKGKELQKKEKGEKQEEPHLKESGWGVLKGGKVKNRGKKGPKYSERRDC